MSEDRNIAVQRMLEDCKDWDNKTNSLREAFSRGEDFTNRRILNLLDEDIVDKACDKTTSNILKSFKRQLFHNFKIGKKDDS